MNLKRLLSYAVIVLLVVASSEASRAQNPPVLYGITDPEPPSCPPYCVPEFDCGTTVTLSGEDFGNQYVPGYTVEVRIPPWWLWSESVPMPILSWTDTQIEFEFPCWNWWEPPFDARVRVETPDGVSNSIAFVSLTNGSGTPDIDVSPLTHDFGQVLVGTSRSIVVTVSNVGDSHLAIIDTSLQGNTTVFSSSHDAVGLFRLPPLQEVPYYGSEDIEITFSPNTPGPISAELEITSDDPDEGLVVVQLNGTGVLTSPISYGGMVQKDPDGKVSVDTGIWVFNPNDQLIKVWMSVFDKYATKVWSGYLLDAGEPTKYIKKHRYGWRTLGQVVGATEATKFTFKLQFFQMSPDPKIPVVEVKEVIYNQPVLPEDIFDSSVIKHWSETSLGGDAGTGVSWVTR